MIHPRGFQVSRSSRRLSTQLVDECRRKASLVSLLAAIGLIGTALFGPPALAATDAAPAHPRQSAPSVGVPATGTKTPVLPSGAGQTGGGGQSGGSATSDQSSSCSPDLRVRRIEIDPPYPRAGQNYRIKIWVLQFLPSGMSESPQSFVAVRKAGHTTVIDSKYVQFATDSTAVRPSYEWTRSDWKPEALEVYVRLDHLNKLHECREDNNEFVHRFTVYAAHQPMADLAFRGHVHFETHNLVNRDVKLWGELVNQGNDETRPFWIDFDCDDDRDARTKLTHRVRVGNLMQPGSVLAFNTRMRWSTPGMKVCIVTLDKDGEVIESNESNNEYIGVTIRVDQPPPVK